MIVMKEIDRDTAKQYIYKTNGKIFSAVFTKKNGEKRKMERKETWSVDKV